jgi:hypothetical protein
MKQATSSGSAIPRHLTPLPDPADTGPGSDLPGWDSFPPLDRHLLVALIVQTARRQLPRATTTHARAARR